MTLTRQDATDYVAYIIDDAGCGREIGDDQYAVVRTKPEWKGEHESILVGWQCGFGPLFVSVHSYLDVALDDDEAVELSTDFL